MVVRKAAPEPQPPYRRAGFATPYAYEKARKAARSYASGAGGAYNKTVPRGAEDFGAYYRAFVSPATSNRAIGKRKGNAGGNRHMMHWVVDTLGAMTKEEFRKKYPR